MDGWISVNDRLPDTAFRESCPCLVRVQQIIGGFLSDQYHYEVASFSSSMRATPKYFSGLKTNGIVTHWMPIPHQNAGEQ